MTKKRVGEENMGEKHKHRRSKSVENAQNKYNEISKDMKQFDEDYQKLLKKLKKKGVDVKSDAVTLKALHTMLKSTIALIPLAEKTYRKNPFIGNNSFVYTGLITKTVELMDAIRSIADLSSQVDHIQNDIVFNAFRYVIQNLAEEIQEIKRWGKLELGKKESNRLNLKLEAMLKNHGVYIKEILAKIEADLNKYLMELK